VLSVTSVDPFVVQNCRGEIINSERGGNESITWGLFDAGRADASRGQPEKQTEHTMKTLHPLPRPRRGFTLIELLVVISIIATLAAIAVPTMGAIQMRGRMTNQVANGRSIFQAMAVYASDKDEFPTYADFDDPNTMVNNSNEAFEILLKGGMLDDKRVLNNNNSAWCSRQAQNESTAKRVLPGENDWSYVAGVRWSVKDSRWPILANAFAPGTTTYVKEQAQKGGAWKGTKAVVIWAGGNGEIVETKEKGSSYFIKRPDKPGADAFQQDGEWLSGDKVKVLHPAG
jgi:prepilin-type N-terminal cleavage/methylation domain-containing protein